MTKSKDQSAKILTPKDGLGFGNQSQKGVNIEDFDYEGFEVVLPPITLEVIKEHDYKHVIIAEGTTQAQWDALDEAEREDLVDAFRQTDGYDEWARGYNPMMLYYWPLFLHGKEPVAVAALLDEFAPAVTLLEIHEEHPLRQTVGEEYAFVLNGGGMDLSDHLALAYICAGSVPPLELLTHLPDVIDSWKVARARKALALAFEEARGSLQNDLARLERARKRLFARPKKRPA